MRLAGIAIAIAVTLSIPTFAEAESAKLVGRVDAGAVPSTRKAAVERRLPACPVPQITIRPSEQRPPLKLVSGTKRRESASSERSPGQAGSLRSKTDESQSLLREELESERGRHQKFGQDSADDAMRLAMEETAKISDQAEDDIATVRQTARGYGQQALIAEITEESRRRQLAVRCNRQAEAKQCLSLAEIRTQALEQTAKTLSDEMAKVHSPGRFGLSPIGSNLYVRNYSHTESTGR
jgi:hypothetical protein